MKKRDRADAELLRERENKIFCYVRGMIIKIWKLLHRPTGKTKCLCHWVNADVGQERKKKQ